MGRFFSHEMNCARARSWTSLEVDGELSQLERVFLAAHLRVCTECERFAADVRSATRLVRQAPRETRGRSFVFPARTRHGRVVAVRLAAAATLAAAAAGLGILAGSLNESPTAPAQPPGDVALLDNSQSQDRELRELRRIRPLPPPRERANPPGRIGGTA